MSRSITIGVTGTQNPETVSIDMTKNSIKYADKTAPSEAWETSGFDIVLDKTTTCTNSRYTPHKVNGVGVATIATRTGKPAPNNVWPGSTASISRDGIFADFCITHSMNMASPKLKNLYFSAIAVL